MKWKFTYKELTLLAGILVAVIIMVTLWMRPLSQDSGEVSEEPTQEIVKPSAKILLKRTFVVVIELIK